MLLRYVGVLLDGNLLITGIVISLLCYAGCVWLLYRLVRQDFDERARQPRAVVYLAIGPLSFFLQAVYTESLFLLLSLACFVFAREGRWRLAGVMGLLATLTRSTGRAAPDPHGLLLLRAARLEAEEDRLPRRQPAHGRRGPAGVDDVPGARVRQAAGVLDRAGAVGARHRRAQLHGDEGDRGHRLGAAQGLSAEYYSLLWEVPRPGSEYSNLATNILNLLFLVVAALLLWYGARRLPGAYSWYALAALAYPLFFPSKYVPLMSYPRFTLTVFPLYVALALYTRDRPRAHKVVVAVGVLLLIGVHGQVRRVQLGGLRPDAAAAQAGSAPAIRGGGGERGDAGGRRRSRGLGSGRCSPPAPTRSKTRTPSLANTDRKFGSSTSRPSASECIFSSSLS